MDGARADRIEIDLLAARLYAAFDNRHALAPLDSLRAICLADALIIKNTGAAPEVHDLEGFIARRAQLLSDGSLEGFSEHEVDARTELAGNVAQRLSLYSKSGVLDGVAFATRGLKCIQFVRTPAGWRISALAWDDERPGFAVPVELHPHGAKP